jgi:hypothetical protein
MLVTGTLPGQGRIRVPLAPLSDSLVSLLELLMRANAERLVGGEAVRAAWWRPKASSMNTKRLRVGHARSHPQNCRTGRVAAGSLARLAAVRGLFACFVADANLAALGSFNRVGCWRYFHLRERVSKYSLNVPRN